MPDTPRLESVSTKRQRIAKLAREAPTMAFTNLAHHIDVEFLRAAFDATRKDGATGVDGQTAADYAAELDANLLSLLNRFKSGSYQAPPVRGVDIPKGDTGKTRPIGIPTFEDKVLQRAVTMVLESVYEQDFMDFSYGFRPGRSAHQALDDLWNKTMRIGGGWVIDVDIQSFFDALDHTHLRRFLDLRIRDGVLRRTIDKWLKAGVMKDGSWRRSQTGTPQGGVVSALLSNVYLHYVLDHWFAYAVQPRLQGRSAIVRYADDVVIAIELESDARRVMAALPQRMARFGLTLHPTKTRFVPFQKPRYGATSAGRDDPTDGGPASPGTFTFLGFTHRWGTTRRGWWVITRETAKDRFKRVLRKLNAWCRDHRHLSIAWQHRKLVSFLRGHCAYFGISGNSEKLWKLRFYVTRIWRKWLNRRSQRQGMPWRRFERVLAHYPLPNMRLVHLTPTTRSKS